MICLFRFRPTHLGYLTLFVAAAIPAGAAAQSSSWSQAGAAGPYNWSDSTNWTGGIIADGANNTATFATPGLTANQSITLDSARTIGNLTFDNPTNNFGWSIGGTSVLTLSNTTAPTIAVNKATITAALAVPLAGTQGFTKTGNGTLSVSGAGDGLSGPITVSAGTLRTTGGTLGSGTISLASGTTLSVSSAAASGFGGTGTGWTANGSATFIGNDVLQITDAVNSQAGSAWLNTLASSKGPYTIKFRYTVTVANGTADGMTVGFQNDPNGLAALGAGGGGLGWQGIQNAAAMAINIYGPNVPGVKAVYQTPAGGVGPGGPYTSTAPINPGTVNQPTDVTLVYDGTSLSGTLVQNGNTYTIAPTAVDIPTIVGGSTAIFGFTGGTGGANAQQQISNFSISQGYLNAVSLAAGSETIAVAATAVAPNVSMGALTAAAGSTLNVSPDATTAANQAFGLTFGAATLNGATTFNVANNGTGTGTLTLGALSGASGSITKTGAGNLVVGGGTIGGGLTVNAGGFSTIANLSIGSLAGTGGTVSDGTASPVTLTVGSDNTSTSYAGNIVDGSTGALSLVKIGTGTLSLTGANAFSGGLSISRGTVSVSSDAAAGTGPVTIGVLGTLNYSATTSTTKSFNLGNGTLSVSSGATLTLNSAASVTNGFLAGGGTIATTATGAVFGNATSRPGITIASNSSLDQFVNFTNGGTLNIAPGLTTPVTLSSFNNQGSGTINVGAGSQVSAIDFQTSGVLNLLPGGSSTTATRLTNNGTAPMFFNAGSRTFVANPSVAGQNLALVDLHGQNAIVSGGLFVNNGFVGDSAGTHKSVIADYGALVKGAGIYADPVITQNGGKFQAGNSPGKATFGQLVLGPGGTQAFNWQINNATGVAGPSADANNQVSGWSLLSAEKIVDPFTGLTSSGDMTWTATSQPGSQFNMALQTLINPITVGQDTQGLMANFDNTHTIGWKLVSWQGNYTGPTDDATLTSTVLFDASNFVNPVLAGSSFQLHYNPAGKEIDVVYAVPEPGTLALVGAAALAGLRLRRKKAKAATA